MHGLELFQLGGPSRYLRRLEASLALLVWMDKVSLTCDTVVCQGPTSLHMHFRDLKQTYQKSTTITCENRKEPFKVDSVFLTPLNQTIIVLFSLL